MTMSELNSGAADPLPSGGGEQTGPVSAAPTLALRLADWARSYNTNMHNRCAAELRRLHAVNAELLELLIEAREELKVEPEMFEFVSRIDAAIAKAGETK
jgi:hypothetical protein